MVNVEELKERINKINSQIAEIDQKEKQEAELAKIGTEKEQPKEEQKKPGLINKLFSNDVTVLKREIKKLEAERKLYTSKVLVCSKCHKTMVSKDTQEFVEEEAKGVKEHYEAIIKEKDNQLNDLVIVINKLEENILKLAEKGANKDKNG